MVAERRSKQEVVDLVLAGIAVAEDYIIEAQPLQQADVDRLLRPLLARLLHELVEGLQRRLGFAVLQDDAADLLESLRTF